MGTSGNRSHPQKFYFCSKFIFFIEMIENKEKIKVVKNNLDRITIRMKNKFKKKIVDPLVE